MSKRLSIKVFSRRSSRFTRARAILVFFLSFVAFCIANSFSLLGFQDASKIYSRDLLYRVLLGPTYPTPKSKAASVLLVRDESFGEFDTFPLSYSTHALFLNNLLYFKPKSLFIDVIFLDNRPDETIGELIEVLKKFKAASIRVYIADEREGGLSKSRPEIKALIEDGTIVPVSIYLGRSIGGTRTYPLQSKPGQPLPAAVAIAQTFQNNSDGALRRNGDEFEIWWGLPPDQLNCRYMPSLCETESFSIFNRFFAILKIESPIFEFRLNKSDPVLLPYTPFLYAEEISDGNNFAHIRRVMSDRHVFYGYDIQFVRDLHRNPVYSFATDERELPGVFFHAMAFENLVDLGPNLKVMLPETLNWFLEICAALICLILVLFIRIATTRNIPSLELSCAFVCLILLAYVSFHHFNLPPNNWIGVLFVLGLVDKLAIGLVNIVRRLRIELRRM